MKGKNLIMCGLCACIDFIGGEVRAYHKVLNELRTTERPKVTYMDYYDKRQRRVDRCVFQNRAEAEKVLEEMIKIIENYGSVSLADYYDLCGVKCDYTDEHYGFVSNDELKKTKIVRCHNGYTHEFSKVMRI